MDEARRQQIEIIRSWTPEHRLLMAFKLHTLAVTMRNARIERQNPGATEEELRDLRCREALGLSPTDPLPWIE
ncbi:MAG: hypothetical protein KDC38_20970, partial [Planctomycetes bacterium]|nr:hypothetical protein [Planctomycetota bacterium]